MNIDIIIGVDLAKTCFSCMAHADLGTCYSVKNYRGRSSRNL